MATDRSESGVQSVTVRAVRASDVSRVWGMIGQLAEYERMTDILTGTPERLAEPLPEPIATRLSALPREKR